MKWKTHLLLAGCVAGLHLIDKIGTPIEEAQAQTSAQQRGKEVYDHWCTPCHAPGAGHPGTQSLEIKYRGELPSVLEEREDLTREYVRTMVRGGILMMAPFRKTEVTDAQLDDIAAYLAD